MEVKRTERFVAPRSLELEIPADAGDSPSSTPRAGFSGRLPKEGFLPQLTAPEPKVPPPFRAARHAEVLSSIQETGDVPPPEFKNSKKPRLRMDKSFFRLDMHTPVDVSQPKFKSLALSAEIKLLEARLQNAKGQSTDGAVSVQSVAACLDILTELARTPSALKELFASMLEELHGAIYSHSHVTYSTVRRTVERVPYFEVLQRMEEHNSFAVTLPKADMQASISALRKEQKRKADDAVGTIEELQAARQADQQEIVLLNQQLQLERYKRQRIESDLQEVLLDRKVLQRKQNNSVSQLKFELKEAQVSFLEEALRKLRDAHDELIRDILHHTKDGTYDQSAKQLQRWVDDVSAGAKAIELHGLFQSASAAKDDDSDAGHDVVSEPGADSDSDVDARGLAEMESTLNGVGTLELEVQMREVGRSPS